MPDVDPQAGVERRACARHLVQHPLTCAEDDPDTFRLIRRHERDLDRWFTQRLGYRLHVDADTARLFKTGVVPDGRPLRTARGRAFHAVEYQVLALTLASTAAGPAVISLRDLVAAVRSAAVEADVALTGDATERRAMVTVLRWMVDHGLATELHAHVDAYATDDEADAVLRLRPDRIVLLPLPALAGAGDGDELLARAERRSNSRAWMRGRLVEEPVLYRDDLAEAEWSELRRRVGEEERLLDEMFGLVVEARAEGIAAIDPAGTLAERRFPAGGTIGHAALLLIDRLLPEAGAPAEAVALAEVVELVRHLAGEHRRRWSADLVAAPEKLTRQVVDVLVDLRLARREPGGSGGPGGTGGTGGPGDTTGERLRLLPAAARFRVVAAEPPPGADAGPARGQETLW